MRVKELSIGVLAVSAVVLQSWPAVVLLALVGVWLGFDRLYPAREPDPTGAELLEELKAHKAAVAAEKEELLTVVNRELADMRGKLAIRLNGGRLRE